MSLRRRADNADGNALTVTKMRSSTRLAARSNIPGDGFFSAFAMSPRMPCVSIGSFDVGRTYLRGRDNGQGDAGKTNKRRAGRCQQ